MDRDPRQDLRRYILRKYYRIKNNRGSEEYKTFLSLFNQVCQVPPEKGSKWADEALAQTENPVDFLAELDNRFWK